MEHARVSCFMSSCRTWPNNSRIGFLRIVLALDSRSARPLRLSLLFLHIRGEERGYADDDILGTTICAGKSVDGTRCSPSPWSYYHGIMTKPKPT
jgi:hypothetical protein